MGRAPSRNDRLELETWERTPTSARSPRASPRGSRAPAEVLETSGPTTCDFPCCLTGQRADDRKGTEEKAKKKKNKSRPNPNSLEKLQEDRSESMVEFLNNL